MADQESRGDKDSCSGEEDSVMWVNLAEGCEAVNDETRRLISLVCLVYLVCGLHETNQINQINQITKQTRSTRQTGPVAELCWLDAFLYKNDCAGH
jgi:hypothetical protein